MGKKNILSIEDKAIIAKRSIKESQCSLAKEYGVSQPTISVMLSKKDQRDIVRREMSKLVANLPDILGAQLEEIKDSQIALRKQLHPELELDSEVMGIDNIDDALALRKYTQSNERELLKSVGVLPTQTTNQYIQQIYNDNRNQVISHDVLKYMGMKFIKDTSEDEEEVEVVDAEYSTIIEDD